MTFPIFQKFGLVNYLHKLEIAHYKENAESANILFYVKAVGHFHT